MSTSTRRLEKSPIAWLPPRLVLWAVLAALGVAASRLAFAAVEMIPHHLDFDPGIALVPAAGVFFGPAGAWGVAAGSLGADRLLGLSGRMSLLRAVALFLFAIGTERLWSFSLRRNVAPIVPAASWTHTLRFVFAAWPGGFAAAAWCALGSEWTRAYPFAYVVSLLILHNILFCTMLGLPLYRAMAAYWVPAFGTWQDVTGAARAGTRASAWGTACIVGGSLGACAAGLAVSWYMYGIGPLEPFVLGSGTGWGVTAAVIPFLVLQVAGVFWGRRRADDERTEKMPRYPLFR